VYRGAGDEVSSKQRIGLAFLLTFLFVSYSRLTDAWVEGVVGFSLDGLWITFIVSTVALAFAILTGGARDALDGRIGRLLLAFTCWLLISTPFSYWQGGSVDMLRYQWSKSFFVFVIVAGLLRSQNDTQRAMVTIGRGVLVAAVASVFFGVRSAEGRLVASQGVLSNPNDVAQMLLIGLPFCWLSNKAAGASRSDRLFALASSVLILSAVLVTGSRSGLVAIASLMLVLVLTVSFTRKIKLLLAAAVLLTTASVLLPAEIWMRYLTIWGNRTSGQSWQERNAFSSNDERQELLKQSLRLTLTHPLVGVGPGVFQVASTIDLNDRGRRALWRETHNTYTQISSEAGLPALVVYLAALGICLRRTYSVWRAGFGTGQLDAVMAQCLFFSLLAFTVTALFSSVAYHYYFPTLAGLTAALTRETPPTLATPRSTWGSRQAAAQHRSSQMPRRPVQPAGRLVSRG
jgi:O-antigen ligase